jgi:hypothetical protein
MKPVRQVVPPKRRGRGAAHVELEFSTHFLGSLGCALSASLEGR